MNKEIIIDSGFFIALLNRRDQYHKDAKKLIKLLPSKKWITTWMVMTEVTHMLVRENAFSAIQGLLDLCENGGIDLFHFDNIHIPRLKQLMQKYQNLPIDLADASLIILAEKLGHGDIVSTDLRDFDTYRWKNHKPFSNLFRI
jgi:predicted nucleic acid-binding protein